MNIAQARQKIKQDFKSKTQLLEFVDYANFKALGAIDGNNRPLNALIKEYKNTTFTFNQGRRATGESSLLSYLIVELALNEAKLNKLY